MQIDDKTSEFTREMLIAKGVRGARSLVDFRREFLSPDIREVAPAKFHYEWSDTLLFSDKSYAIEGFRESSKTSYIVDVYPQYKIFYPDEYITYIVLLKQNATLAAKSLKEIERNVMENKWISGKIMNVVEQSGEAFEIVTISPQTGKKMSIRIEAYGKGSSIRGLKWRNKRPSIVLADDLQDEEDAKSQTALDNDWVWFRSEVGFLGQYTRFFMIANNLGEKCIIEQIAANPDDFGFVFDKVPIITEVNEKGIPAWGDRFSREFILDEYEKYKKTGDIAIWMRNRMCVAVSPETQVFHKDDLRWYVAEEKQAIMERCNVFAAYDPTGTNKKKSDMAAIPIIGVDEEDYWYILDIRYSNNWSPTEQLDILFDVIREYNPYRTGIETVAAHGGLLKQSINKLMTEKRCMFTPAWITPSNKISKEERIILALAQRVKLGKLVLPEKASWLNELLVEMMMFTRDGAKSKYDDVLDSVAMFAEFAKAPISKEGGNRSRKNHADLPRSSIGSTVYR